jgi:HK97 family phage major capsid protein
MLTETAESLGTAGDLRLVNWQDYVTIEKSGGIQNAMSMHLFFDADQMAFRATFRADGQPWLDAAVSKNKGSNKLSSIVELS